MNEFLDQLESSLGVPAELLERAAAARAGASGISAENIIRSWAGAGEAPEASPAPEQTATEAPAAAAPPPAEAAASPPAEPAEADDAGLEVEVLEATEPAPADEDEPPAESESAGALAGFPSWLAGAVLVIPVLALAYVLLAPNGPSCGASGQLAVDAETGLAENCDGTEYGVDAVSFFTIGEDVYNGSGRCAGCHAEDGTGGTGPAMTGGAVLVTFPAGSCSDHVRWTALGTDNWPDATYGAAATPVGSSGAAMPGFEGTLTPEELAAVAVYERVAFGGQALADAEADCGTEQLELATGE